MRSEDQFFRGSRSDDVWQRYCGFLDLSVEEFCRIQQGLLTEQLAGLSESALGKRLAPGLRAHNVDEFRHAVRPTRYEDYEPCFVEAGNDGLVESPHYWVETSARRGTMKRVPWVSRFHTTQRRNVIAALILSSARDKGDVGLAPGCRVLHLLPGKPFASAWLANGVADEFSVTTIPPLDMDGGMTFSRRIDAAISMGLRTNVDYVVAMTSSLVRIGQSFNKVWTRERQSMGSWLHLHPPVALRLYRARHHDVVFPRDAWAVKGVVSWGADSADLAGTIEEQWGPKPVQMYGSSEGGLMAMQDWRKGSMAFIPDSVFFEFIPQESAHLDNPSTLLINEVEENHVYELVITNFYGMPFLRYRQGDLVRIVRNDDSANRTPRMEFLGRADDTLDLFGIARLDTRGVAEAMAGAGLSPTEWCLRKEIEGGRVILSLYTELAPDVDPAEVGRRFSRALKRVDRHWGEAVHTMAYNPIRVKPVARGAFRRSGISLRKAGLTQISPPESVVAEPGGAGEAEE